MVGETEYLDCRDRSRALADVPLERARQSQARRRQLSTTCAPCGRRPSSIRSSTWLQSSLAFSLWLEETKLEFYQSGDVNVLRRRYGEMEPARGCAAALEQVQRGISPTDAQYDMVVLPWHNCVNDLFRRRLGDYPMAAWQRFLSKWGIQERFVEPMPQASGK